MRVAIIPARGGSKRIKRKNIKSFLGKPIMAYSIELAFQSKLFDKIIVSTDDPEIAEIGKKLGADIPFIRPQALSDDYVGTAVVMKHALDCLCHQGEKIDLACCIYATAPFIKTEYLKLAYEKLISSRKDYAFSVTHFRFPIQRALKKEGAEGVQPFFPDWINQRSQDLEEAFHDAGQFYWGRAQAFSDSLPLFGKNSIPIFLPTYLVQDIDTEEDWMHAELMYQSMGLNCEVLS